MTPPRKYLSTVIFIAGLAAITLFFLLLKVVTLHPYLGDEYIYFYQGSLVAGGEIPYRDFAMAHPPLQTLFTAVYLKTVGINLFTMRLLPIGWCLLGGLILALMVRRELGTLAGLLAPFFYLFNYEPLRASTHFTGVNMTVALLLVTVYLYRLGHLRTAALFAVLSVITRFYAIPTIAVLTIFALTANRKDGLRLIFYGALFGTVMLIGCGLWSGFPAIWQNIFVYHAQKTPMSPHALLQMKIDILFHHTFFAALFFLATSALVYIIGRAYLSRDPMFPRRQRVRDILAAASVELPLLAALIAVTMLVILTSMDRVWMYYFIPAFPFAAVVAAWYSDLLLKGVTGWWRAGGKFSATGMQRSDAAFGLAAVIVLTLSCLGSSKLERCLDYYQREIPLPLKDRTHLYTFKPSVFAPGISSFIEQTFWQPIRVIGETYTTINYYLWHESRVFDLDDKAVAVITAETKPGEEIFGDSGTVPLLALLSGRLIAGNEVDTNIQRYRSGNADPKALIAKIDREQTKLIILRHRFGVSGVLEVRNLVETKYRHLQSLRSAEGTILHIFKRNEAQDSS